MLNRFFRAVRLPLHSTSIRVALCVTNYVTNNNTCIEAYKPTLRGYEDWDVVTVNTDTALPKDCACIDTNHHGQELVDRLIKLKLGIPTGQYVQSGFCLYPVFKFDLKRLKRFSVVNNKIND